MNWKLFWKGVGRVALFAIAVFIVIAALSLTFPDAAARYIKVAESPQVEVAILVLRIAFLAIIGGLLTMWSGNRR